MEKALWNIWHTLVALFLAPGDAMMRSLAKTPWGQDWGVSPEPDIIFVIGVSILFWCILFSLLGAMDDKVRGFLGRRERRRDE